MLSCFVRRDDRVSWLQNPLLCFKVYITKLNDSWQLWILVAHEFPPFSLSILLFVIFQWPVSSLSNHSG